MFKKIKYFLDIYGLGWNLLSLLKAIGGTAMGAMFYTLVYSIGDWFTVQPTIVQVVWVIPCLIFGFGLATEGVNALNRRNFFVKRGFLYGDPILVEYKKERVIPYFQVINRDIRGELFQVLHSYTIQICRISITKLGSGDIPNMQIKLINIQPMPDELGGLDLPMHFMHDNTQPYRDHITLTSGNKVFVDIASLVLGNASFLGGGIMIEHSVHGIRKNIPEREYIFTIQVTGTNIPMVAKRLKIWTNYDLGGPGGLFMEILED